MSSLIPILTLRQSIKETTTWVMQRLLTGGFQVERTFDLQTARLAHPDFACPYHGTEECTCQMTVLIIHSGNQCTTVIAHGRDEHTSLTLINGTNQSIEKKVIQVLLPPAKKLEIESHEMAI